MSQVPKWCTSLVLAASAINCNRHQAPADCLFKTFNNQWLINDRIVIGYEKDTVHAD